MARTIVGCLVLFVGIVGCAPLVAQREAEEYYQACVRSGRNEGECQMQAMEFRHRAQRHYDEQYWGWTRQPEVRCRQEGSEFVCR